MSKLVGNFYYNRTVNGNLLGEFTNNLDDRILSESCNPREHSGSFIGVYDSSWQQGTDTYGLTLSITAHGAAGKFKLSWRNPQSEEYFGEGFLVGEMLIGYYVQRD